ncbi:MAG: hypothetical protein ACREFP_16750 [Acetobacteraceae bacterium]
MSGITIEIPDAAVAPAGTTEITLPSGAVAAVRQGTGRDLRLAQMAAGQPFDALKFEYALLAQVATVEGKLVRMEQIDAMRIDDVLELQGAMNRVNFPTRKPASEAAS